MSKFRFAFYSLAAITSIAFLDVQAQTIPGKSYLFSNSLVTDSTMIMASWWNSNQNTVTYEAWIKPVESNLSFDTFRNRAVYFKQHYGTSGLYLTNKTDGTSGIKVVMPGIANPWVVSKLPPIPDKQWTYVAVVFDGPRNKVTVWVNDSKADSIMTEPLATINFWSGHMPGGDGNLNQVRPFTMGCQWPYYPGRTTLMPLGRTSVDRFFRGEMDEIRVWNVARTDDQIRSSMYQPVSGKETGLLACYNFETISSPGDSLINLKTGKLDAEIWGKNLKSGFRKSYAMVRPELKSVEMTKNGFTVSWNPIADVGAYFMDVATDSSFSNVPENYKNIRIAKDLSSYEVNVINATKYFVRIRAGEIDESSVSANSSVVSANVAISPVKNIQLSGENGINSIVSDRGVLKIIASVVTDGTGITNNSVTWSVDNQSLATINQQGLLTANANGTVIVKATSAVTPSVSASISIEIKNQVADTWVAPVLKYPATLYWGGYQNMNQLVATGANWDFVKQNMDGFLFHGAYWANVAGFPEVPAVAAKLAPILKPLNKKNLMELGWPGTYTQFQPTADMALKKAQGHVASLDKMKLWGINVDEINIDWHLYLWKPLCITHPDWNVADITAWVTGDFSNYTGPATIYKPGYFPDYVNTIRKSYPSMTFYAVDSPVWFWWDNYPSLGNSGNNQRFNPLTGFDPVTGADNNIPVLVKGQPVSFLFNWHGIMDGIIRSTGASGFEGLGSDYPYDYTQWYDPVARESCFQKVLVYEKWFHSVGKKHTLICNTSDGDKLYPSDHDQWDKNYHEKSMAAMMNYQKRGGRADRYLFESWYSGPYTVVPETKQYSYTNLVRNAIYYLKGIDQKLDLQIRREFDANFSGINEFQTRPNGSQNLLSPKNGGTQTYVIRLLNPGNYACYPMLKALTMKATGWNISFYVQNVDITSQITGEEGYTGADLLQPGTVAEIKVVVSENQQVNHDNLGLSVWAFWNPQDPAQTIRDVVSITYDGTVGIEDQKLLLDPQVSCYPNPVSGILNIDFKELVDKAEVEIFSLTGCPVYQKDFTSVQRIQINAVELNIRGVYILQAILDKKRYSMKVNFR